MASPSNRSSSQCRMHSKATSMCQNCAWEYSLSLRIWILQSKADSKSAISQPHSPGRLRVQAVIKKPSRLTTSRRLCRMRTVSNSWWQWKTRMGWTRALLCRMALSPAGLKLRSNSLTIARALSWMMLRKTLILKTPLLQESEERCLQWVPPVRVIDPFTIL